MILRKWSAPCTVTESTWSPAMLYVYKSQIRPQNRILIPHLDWSSPSPHFPAITEFKSVYILCEELFLKLQPLSRKRNVIILSPLCPYFRCKFLVNLNSLVPPVPSLRARTRYAMFIGLNRPHSLRIPMVRGKFHSLFPQELLLVEEAPKGVSLSTTMTCVSLGSTVISPIYPLHILSLFKPLKQSYSLTSHLEWLLCLVFGEHFGNKENLGKLKRLNRCRCKAQNMGKDDRHRGMSDDKALESRFD